MLHNPGLKLVLPSSPADVLGLLRSSIRDPDPVIFMPNKGLFFTRALVPTDPEFILPLGQAALLRDGTVATIITYSGSVPKVIEASEQLAAEGIDVEVIDLRTLVPLDWESVSRSVSKTRRAMIVHEACRTGGVGAELAARIQEEMFGSLLAPVMRVCGADTHIPQNARLEQYCVPSVQDIAVGVRSLLRH